MAIVQVCYLFAVSTPGRVLSGAIRSTDSGVQGRWYLNRIHLRPMRSESESNPGHKPKVLGTRPPVNLLTRPQTRGRYTFHRIAKYHVPRLPESTYDPFIRRA